MILVGILPGPKEPKGCINTYLYPLVEELLDLWKQEGVNIKCNLSMYPGP